LLIARNGNFEINTPKLALVITQYIDAYNKSHSGGLSPGPSVIERIRVLEVFNTKFAWTWGQAMAY